jgi:primosomal protein N' (replication factor Y) (superfamily II helicase)
MNQTLVDIALPVPLDRTFTYLVPPELSGAVELGRRVLVPFGRKKLSGVIVGFPASPPAHTLRPLLDVLDTRPTFSEEMLKLTRWMAEYYLAPWGDVLKAASPQGTAASSKLMVHLATDSVDELIKATKKTAHKQHAILQALADAGTLSAMQLQKKTNAKSIHATLADMQQRGWIALGEERRPTTRPKTEKVLSLLATGNEVANALTAGEPTTLKITANQQKLLNDLMIAGKPLPVRDAVKLAGVPLSTVTSLEKKGLLQIEKREVLRGQGEDRIDPPATIVLNPDQERALTAITSALSTNLHKTFLLHGITGSGKTQVYIEAIRVAIQQKKNAIVLVPEISLTPQTVRRFKSHFGSQVAVMHSQMSVGERYDTWRLAHEGRIRIVIGPRSAIFAPLQNLGLIVVDEEPEGSYKQFDSSPRYHARDVAIVRASFNKAVVVLGSATPSAESYYNAINGKYELLKLPERADNAQLPKIEIVDMAQERRRKSESRKKEIKEKGFAAVKPFTASSISFELKGQIEERLRKQEGTILLQNRRGFSHVVECFDCGFVERCDNCDVTLTFHATKKHLRCHYCGFVKQPPTLCPACHGKEIRHHAFGTQQVHEELAQLFPTARILRMDLDTTSRKGAHDRLLSQFGAGQADILLGTQMVAKGLDFPRVTLVGVISADTQMLLPDFRSAERTFQLLTQVAGRAGRSKLTGEVIIQTLQPDHYSLKHATTHDFAGFYREELEYRRELDYPPFSRIVLVEFKGVQESEVGQHANKFAEFLTPKAGKHFIVLGPADAAIPKIKNQYRKHLVIKSLKAVDPAGSYVRAALSQAREQYLTSSFGKNRRVQMTIDVDPQGMM